MTEPRVDVVILTWNDGELLERALTSALESRAVETGVVVVDNGSDPPATVPDDHRVRLLRNDENLGVPAGRNQGVAATTAPLVCLLDSDARLHPDSLATLADAVLSAPDIGVAVPVFTDQAPEASAGRAPSLTRKVARGLNLVATYGSVPRDGQGLWDVEFGIGACQLIRRSVFDKVGGLDDSYLFGPEDVDFCVRVRRHGYRVVQVPSAVVDHPPRRGHRRLLTRRGMAHGWALARHYWRQRPRPNAH